MISFLLLNKEPFVELYAQFNKVQIYFSQFFIYCTGHAPNAHTSNAAHGVTVRVANGDTHASLLDWAA
jgi:hypothetical protein